MRLRTDRLILRRPETEDLGSVLRLLSDQAFAAAVPEIPRTGEELRGYLKGEGCVHQPAQDKCFNLFLERREDGRLMGLTTLVLRKDCQGEIGYALHGDYRGCGYATEAARVFMDYAFAQLGLHRIYAEARSDNAASWRVMERLGMRREACFREMVHEQGEWRDVVIHAVLTHEWLAR